jgi:hypothetical protein
VETLCCVAALRSEKGTLRTRFHAFGHDPQTKGTAQPDHRPHNGLGIRIAAQSRYEGAVDLDLVNR